MKDEITNNHSQNTISEELTPQEQKYLLELARKNLNHYFQTQEPIKLMESEIPFPALKEKRATFATLTKNGQLRGCIGMLEPIRPLYQDVIENSISAAIHDYRFEAVTAKELADINLEISVLSLPVPLDYQHDAQILKNILALKKPGVIIRQGSSQATFLPQVWEQLPDAESFLAHLCAKAGLSSAAWQTGALEVETYTAQKFKETK
jgi:hypothetical protein